MDELDNFYTKKSILITFYVILLGHFFLKYSLCSQKVFCYALSYSV